MTKRALVVDDSQTMRTMIKSVLQAENFDCITAEDGVAAIEILGSQTVDVVVTDINMPNMDGIELVKNLRAAKNAMYTPILVISTESGDTIKQQGKQAGASGWIVKPFQPEVLIKAVKKLTLS